MIHDLAESPPAALPAYDLCVVGSGPAGLTLARELSGSGLRVAVLESGRRRVTAHHDALRPVDSEGLTIKEYSRERVLGGASTTWSGLSAPFDPIDFEPRPWLARSGWDLPRAALEPLWQAAAARYRFGAPEDFAAFEELAGRGCDQRAWGELEEKVFLAAAEPQDFGAEHAAACEADDIDLWLDATVTALETDGGEAVRRVQLVTSGGERRALEARAFVLATGGLENPRLLLQSTDRCAAGLGNERDQVGRCLMNHPKHYHGLLRLAAPVRDWPYHFGCLHRGFAGYAGLRLPDALQRERRLVNSYVRFEPLFPWSGDKGVESLVFLVKRSKGLSGAFKKRSREQPMSLRDYSETGDDSELQNARKHLADWLGLGLNVVLHAPMVARYGLARLRQGRSPAVSTIRLRNFMEMEAHPDNRVTLGKRRDANGCPVPLVRHRPTDTDKRSMAAVHEALGRAVEASGFARLEGALTGREEPWPIDEDASHHMGTTRLGHDPATSVVDSDLRVHELDNLYCAGASVFPTSGCANPTFTLVALSIRLAAHLRERLGAAAASDPARAPGDRAA